MQFRFGSGSVWGTPTSDANGNAIATPTPVQLAVLQEFSLDAGRDLKELYGSATFPVDVAMGKSTISGKAKLAQTSGILLASLVFGQPMTTGSGAFVVDNFAATIPTTPFTVTVTPPNSGTYLFDLGVRDSNGLPMTRVTSAPTAGQYSVNASGVYTFASADTGKAVYISYQYTASVAGSKRLLINNLAMGTLPQFRMDYQTAYKGKIYAISLPFCVAGKTNLASAKIDDHDQFELEFKAFADPVSGRVIDMTVSD